MVTHRKPPFYRMCNDATQRRLPIFAVLFLNLFIDLTTIDGHVLPRPLATSTVTTFTTSSIPSTTSSSITTTTTGSTAGERNFSTAGSNTTGTSATPPHPSRSVPFDLSTLITIAPFGARTSATNFSTESNVRANQHTGTVPYGEGEVNNTAGGRVLVVVPDSFAIGQLRQGFRNFVTLLQSNRPPVPSDRIDQNGTLLDSLIQFRPWRDMVAFERWLEDPAFATVLYMSDEGDSFIGYCDSLSTHLSAIYRKSVLFWPCPRMKATEKFIPSYETVSFAVKSIAQQLNWTEAVLLATDANRALSLALASNLHIPYTIAMDATSIPSSFNDSNGKVVIICSSINSPQTISVINQLKQYSRTKILLLDLVGTIFNSNNVLYRRLAENGAEPFGEALRHRRNLLVLTILTEKFRSFLHRLHGVDLGDYKHISENLLKIRLMDDKLPRDTGNDDDGDGADGLNATTDDAAAPSAYGDEQPAPVPDHPPFLPPHPPEMLLELLSLATNGTNASESCDFHYLLTQVANWYEILAQTFDTARCQTLFGSYCEAGVGHGADSAGDRNLHHPSSSPVNNETDRALANRSLEATIDEIERFCDLFLASYDRLLADELSTITTTSSSTANASWSWGAEATPPPTTDHLLMFGEHFYFFDYLLAVVEDAQPRNGPGYEQHRKFQFDFVAFDFKNISHHRTAVMWRPFLILQQSQLHRHQFSMHPVPPGYADWVVEATLETIWICGVLCWAIVGLVGLIAVAMIVGSIVFSIAVRNYIIKTRLSKGPNKIVLSPSDFVFPVDMRRVDEGIEAMLCCWLQQLQEFGGPEVEKPDLLKGSIGSLKNLGLPAPTKPSSGSETLIRHSTAAIDHKARYNGDLVQLKEIPSSSASHELKTKAMDLLVMAHGLRHENINPLIGWLNEPSRTALVFEHCSRGSLQDVLIMDEIKLDWSFRLSLLTDLVRGMRYLHASPLRVHGSLSSRNCVVDARWVLKITDYGMLSFYEAQGIAPAPRNAKELLWTAPEALRDSRTYPKAGTQPADVYAFGIIMQEVVVRGEPYCMLSLTPDEIIAKIKKPPPLIRPSVSKGAAPPEAINIMRQCWAENPEMRPDFATICERFKQLNHGRKVNFVDTMFQMLEKYSNNLEELIRERTELLDIERKKTEQLLNRMLPSSVAEKLKLGLAVEPEEFAEVTIYFSDIVGFTTIAAHCTPVQVVDLLNDLYTCFDATINAYNVYKVETIGDAYMVVSGLPVRTPDHAEQIATMALDLLSQSGHFKVRHLPGVPLQLRIGLHTGPCCAGVVGLTMPRYCLFGDTVNTASRMESTGSSWRIHMSQQTCNLLEKAGGYVIEPRGPIEIKGKGKMHTYWLLGKKGFDKALPPPPPIGLDVAILKHSLFQSQQNHGAKINNASIQSNTCSTANHSSSHSPSVAGESIDVKVEITPPVPPSLDPGQQQQQQQPGQDTAAVLSTSFSIESSSSNNTFTLNLGEFGQPKASPLPSPQARKLSEVIADGSFLSAGATFDRLNPSPSSASASSTRLFKRIEELIDLSSPYNYYKCLSPSENNLSQCTESRYGSYQLRSDSCSSKPGSTRFLRRQFSLDKDDVGPSSGGHGAATLSAKATLDTISSISVDREQLARMGTLTSIPSISSTNSATLPGGGQKQRSLAMHRQQSASVAQDLEKIEEIPLSPQSFIINHTGGGGGGSSSTSSLQSEVNERGRSFRNGASTAPNGHSGKELRLSVEALGLR
uniref:Guanylate cyclase n=1 Tax=Anopheles arabiensis TaxID=7173 RepID=A0A499FT77_ANOAR